MEKVLVAMSGGVDSSVTAKLLKSLGYDVEGISFILYSEENHKSTNLPISIQEASRVAQYISIQHHILDVRKEFLEKVINPFINAYLNGLTPNPCILCNKFIKFPILLKEAKNRGAKYIATGHYARVESAKSIGLKAERFLLKKGVDTKKDQSYFLYVLTQKELKRLLLPLGNLRKDEVRVLASGLKLSVSNRPESQEICFIKDKRYSKFIERFTSTMSKPGPIMDIYGNIVGNHKGVYGYTVGQRKGLGISAPKALYVVKIDTMRNIIYVGSPESVKKKEILLKDINWVIPPPSKQFRASVKMRSMMNEEPAIIEVNNLKHSADKLVRVVFDKPQWAPAPGQSAVLYDGETLIGGGVII